jgi:FlaG/FlaF family flagellin (archaellin)
MNKRAIALVVAGILVGAIVGPPVVQAATQLVTLKGAGSNNKAKVTGQGALRIDTEAGVTQGLLDTLAISTPAGVETFSQGTASTTVPATLGLLTNAVVDLPSGQGPVTVSLADDLGEIWQGTVDGGDRHLNDTFDSGLIWVGDLQVTVTGTGAEFTLDGLTLGGFSGGRSGYLERSREALRRASRR